MVGQKSRKSLTKGPCGQSKPGETDSTESFTLVESKGAKVGSYCVERGLPKMVVGHEGGTQRGKECACSTLSCQI